MSSITKSSQQWAKLGKELMDKICIEVDIEDLPWNEGELDIKEFIKRYKAFQKLVQLEHDLIVYLDFKPVDKPTSTIKMINELRKCIGDMEEYK